MNNPCDLGARTLRLLILAVLAAACSLAGTPAGGPAAPQAAAATPTPATPTPSPTPPPELLLVGEMQGTLASALQDWAEQRGWVLREAAGADIRPETAAAVLAGAAGEAALPALSEAGLPAATVDIANAAAGARLSTVGWPGARLDQAGFLAGAAAALITRTNWVGLIGEPGGQTAFEHGLRYLCVNCSLVALEPAAATADAFRAKTVDVVAVLPGAEASQAAQALSGQGLWLVLVDQPAEALSPAEVAAQLLFEPGAMLTSALEALLAGEPGGAWPYSIDSGGIVLADLNPEAISLGRQQLLLTTYQALAKGDLAPGVDTENGD